MKYLNLDTVQLIRHASLRSDLNDDGQCLLDHLIRTYSAMTALQTDVDSAHAQLAKYETPLEA